MKTKVFFKSGDRVRYGDLKGQVVHVWKELKRIECEFHDEKGRHCVLFFYDGRMEYWHQGCDYPMLEKMD